VSPVRLVHRAEMRGYKPIRVSSLRGYNNETAPGTIASNEMDTMADTSCAGRNWTPIYFTGDTVEVAPFTNSYQPLKDTPVATCATIVTTATGQDYLLVGHEMLFFGSTLHRSLINPNQLRMNGVKVVDDPTVEKGFGMQIFLFPFLHRAQPFTLSQGHLLRRRLMT
jgi:hypothetical protein